MAKRKKTIDLNGFVGVERPDIDGRCLTVIELRNYLTRLVEIGRGNWPVAIEVEDGKPEAFYPSWDTLAEVVLLDQGDEVPS